MLAQIADDNSGIVASRKRKLREFFAVCDTQDPIPNRNFDSVDAQPTTVEEARFLEVSDILQYVISLYLSRFGIIWGLEGEVWMGLLMSDFTEAGSSMSLICQRVANYGRIPRKTARRLGK